MKRSFSQIDMDCMALLILLQVCLTRALPQGSLYANNTLGTPDAAIQRIQSLDGFAEILPSTEAGTSFTITTSLQTSGRSSVFPFPTSRIAPPTSTASPARLSALFNSLNASFPAIASASAHFPFSNGTAFASSLFSSGNDTNDRVAAATNFLSINATVWTDDLPEETAAAATNFISTSATAATSVVTEDAIVGPTQDSTAASMPCGGPAVAASQVTVMATQNIFSAISTKAPPSNIGQRGDHPVPRQGIIAQSSPIATNKFYANFFLGSRGQPTWTHPYVVSWCKGTGNAKSWGLCVSHVEAGQKVFAPGGPPPQYYINPGGLQSIILSAAELNSGSVISMDTLTAFSANVNFHATSGAPPGLSFPLVQGMGFVTARYKGLRPYLQSSIFFRDITRVQKFYRDGVIKFRITLEDGKKWLVYATPNAGQDINLRSVSNSLIEATGPFTGTIQVAKNPNGAVGEAIYDAAAGAFAAGAQISGTINGVLGTYTLSWIRAAVSPTAGPLLMFALYHHLQSFDPATYMSVKQLLLDTTTKGPASAVVKDSWTMQEGQLPTDMGFDPWSPSRRSIGTLSAAAVQRIIEVGASEVSQNIDQQTNLDSMYFSGKALSKFATILYTLYRFAPSAVGDGLDRLKAAFGIFVANRQKYPLVYDTAWKGVVSTGSYVTGDAGQDFGNTFYNDHHFHYGYFIHTAAIIGRLDPSWLTANKDYVNLLVRDAANPSTDDTYFPFSRSFDWYHGHSWAKGLFESGDGKDEESSSEDAFFAYAMKMWGQTVRDANMEARGNLMLSILARTLRDYFLMESTNTIQPKPFVDNKVTGILFENKADHVTYFGANIEYIQGIHMIPLNPSSTLTRNTIFVREEWDRFFNNGRVDQVAGGWRGILYANLAIIDPRTAYNFFAQQNFDPGWIDGGASRTWYLAYAAGLGGSP